MLSIDTDYAEDILWGGHVAKQWVSDHRWHTTYLVVFEHPEHPGELMGFYYLEPATEMQEGSEVYEGDPVPIFPVTSREIVKTIYEEARDTDG